MTDIVEVDAPVDEQGTQEAPEADQGTQQQTQVQAPEQKQDAVEPKSAEVEIIDAPVSSQDTNNKAAEASKYAKLESENAQYRKQAEIFQKQQEFKQEVAKLNSDPNYLEVKHQEWLNNPQAYEEFSAIHADTFGQGAPYGSYEEFANLISQQAGKTQVQQQVGQVNPYVQKYQTDKLKQEIKREVIMEQSERELDNQFFTEHPELNPFVAQTDEDRHQRISILAMLKLQAGDYKKLGLETDYKAGMERAYKAAFTPELLAQAEQAGRLKERVSINNGRVGLTGGIGGVNQSTSSGGVRYRMTLQEKQVYDRMNERGNKNAAKLFAERVTSEKA